MATAEQVFLKYSIDKLEQLGGRIQSCLDRITEEQIWGRNSGNENAVGNLVLHLCGNVRQWIGFGVLGMADIRNRDREFQARGGVNKAELSERLTACLNEVISGMRQLTDADLVSMTRVQNYDITKLEAIYHVVEHFSQHTGQIIFATKWLTGEDLAFYGHLKSAAALHAEKTP